MVTHTDLCSYTEYRIYPGVGRRFIAKDGKLHFFVSNKARQMYHQRIKPVKLTWTTAWRRFNKKLRVDEANKKKRTKTVKVQKSIVGMKIDEINRMKAETRGARDKLHDDAQAQVKARKAKEIQERKAKMDKMARNAPKQPAQPKNQKQPAKGAGKR